MKGVLTEHGQYVGALRVVKARYASEEWRRMVQDFPGKLYPALNKVGYSLTANLQDFNATVKAIEEVEKDA